MTPLRYETLFDPAYMNRPGVRPLRPIRVVHADPEANDIVKTYLEGHWRTMARAPVGELRHPFFVPGATYNNLWDWDSFFTACGVPDEGMEYARGSIENLLAATRGDGRPPKMASPEGHYQFESHPIPLHAQFAYLVARREDLFDWIEPHWTALKRIRRWYEGETIARGRFFVWTGFQGNGIDNNPAVYGRPPRSSAGVDLACWHYREYVAMSLLARCFEPACQAEYVAKAADLRELIRTRYWDVVDRFFYAVDCLCDEGQTSLQKVTWETFLKFRNVACLFPLWAGVATREQAEAVRRRMMSPQEFLSVAGLRSHSAADPLYNNTPMGNPSNWQGPVWGLSTSLGSYALAQYGYVEDALEIMRRQVRTLAADIAQNGCMHEYYHGDSGQPIMKPGFISWNVLLRRGVDDLLAGTDCTTLDLLDEQRG